MNQEPSIRTISVRYTIVFCIIIGFLFLFSQILDTLFYDYTVIETEIVFIKKVDANNSKMIIELNEVTETSYSLVLTIQNNMQNTIDQIYRKIHYNILDVDNYTYQQLNFNYRHQFNSMSYSVFLNTSKIQSDSIEILNIKNTINSFQADVDISIYTDEGVNFFDLAQKITLNNYWNIQFHNNFKNKIVTKYFINGNKILLIFHDYISQLQEVAILKDNQIQFIYNTNQIIRNICVKNNMIILEILHNRNLELFIFSEDRLEQLKSIKLTMSRDIQFYQIIQLFFINEQTIAIIYVEMKNDKFILIGEAINENKNIFLTFDITDQIIGNHFEQIEFLYDFNEENNILLISFCKKYLFFLKIMPFMLTKNNDVWNLKRIRLYIDNMEREVFKKIKYSHEEHYIYIMSETYQQKFKMYIVDLNTLEELNNNKLDTLKLRMPYFRTGMIAKDFQIKKNQLNNYVILFLLQNGDVACIQPLEYGEGVLKKTFIIELLDIILTLSFIGFFRYCKRILQKIYSKIIACCRRI